MLFDYNFWRNTNTTQSFPTNNKTEILKNLTTLGLSDQSIQRILNAVDNMPCKTHVEGALKFLTETTKKKSVRENYYQHSKYFAEYFCTISNLGFFAVAYYYNDYATLLAGTFSALSHAIPSQRLYDLDMLGVFAVFAKVALNYNVVLKDPSVIAWGIGAISLNIADTIITRAHLDKVGPWLHVTWHLAAALALYKFNTAQATITAQEMESISFPNALNQTPGFLQESYDKIGKHLGDFTDTVKNARLKL